MAGFTVDTKLFEELGELLVAKEATALVELVKNAYDADATVVNVAGSDLDQVASGSIVVEDDGIGMADDDFRKGFLTIAGRTKTSRDRYSPIYRRRYTGEKGVGRLAAHKLARKLDIRSLKAGGTPRVGEHPGPAKSELRASIDWDQIEALETLDEVNASNAVTTQQVAPLRPDLASGTTLRLGPLRRPWTRRMIDEFLREAVTLAPMPVLWQPLPKRLLSEPLLFKKVAIRDQSAKDPGFRINFLGDLAVPDLITPEVVEAAHWIAELDFDRESGLLRVAIAPTATGLRETPLAEGFRFEHQLEAGVGPSFRARVLQRSGRAWHPAVQGIRVYMEGFRVPPYGDTSDDWLELDETYRSRAHRQLTKLADLDLPDLPEGLPIEDLAAQPNAAYMGAVFLHRASTPELQMLVNREGFLSGPGLDFIVRWVRVATDLIVRLGYASRQPVKAIQRQDRERQRRAAKVSDVTEAPSAHRVRESVIEMGRQLDLVRSAIEDRDFGRAAAAAKAARPHLAEISALSTEAASEAVMWRVLASLGTELAAFVHEINALALEASAIVADLDESLGRGTPAAARPRIQRARKTALALADRIRRNAAYLVDATSFSGRRRRSRVPVREQFEAVLPFFETRLARRGIEVENAIPADLRSPPMFPAELTGIFTNLVSNAVKFAEAGGRIRATAEIGNDTMNVTVENTGDAVDLRRAARLFEPFHSTTQRPDAVLGQGMGMGLTITRAFVQEYGGDIAFVPPSPGFSTAIRFEIPTR